ncbi:hypothetical protein [Actinomadura verrucosospora]
MCHTTCRRASVQFTMPGTLGNTHGEHYVHSFERVFGIDARAIEKSALARARALFGPDMELRVVRDYTVSINLEGVFYSPEVKVETVGPRVEANVTVTGNNGVTITVVVLGGSKNVDGGVDSRSYHTGYDFGRSKKAIRKSVLAEARRAFGPKVKLRIARGCTYKTAGSGYYSADMKVIIVG